MELDRLIETFGLRPVLVDVGASGHPPVTWSAIARHSTYVGFDPDRRELRDEARGDFARYVLVNQSVSADTGDDDQTFYYTASPFCSSTLRPDGPALAQYLFADMFEVERTDGVPATTLNDVGRRFDLDAIHWLKLDTQGTDLRIFESLDDDLKRRVLAIDIEPGLIDAYVGEDKFTTVHERLTDAGFWLCAMNVLGSVRISRDAVRAAMRMDPLADPSMLERTAPRSPGWCEARYLRTSASLDDTNDARQDDVMLWIFSMLAGQYGFAIEMADRFERRGGADTEAELMLRLPIERLRRQDRCDGPLRRLTRRTGKPRQASPFVVREPCALPDS
ncbi:MAG: hypothetical protein CMJ18_15930 [Phycisphaeraceae bacterium]|nr:hypothetical protein [Phycisphaeraceae bacterium]